MNRFASFVTGPFRFAHRWAGVALALFILVIATTGVLLNHREWLPGAQPMAMAGERKPAPGDKPAKPKVKLTPSLDAAAILPLQDALAIAKEKLGAETPVESITLGSAPGGMAWTFRSARGADPGFELTVHAKSGEAVLKTTQGYTTTGADGTTTFAWNRLAMDLHTGKFWNRSLGPWLFSDLTAVGMWLLTTSGVCLWAVPAWRRRQRRA